MGKVKDVDRVISRGEKRLAYLNFFWGLFMCGISIFMLLSFLTADITLDPVHASAYCSTGLIGSWIAYAGILSFGKFASFFAAVLVFLWGSLVMKEGKFLCTWVHVLGGILMLMAVSLLNGIVGGGDFYAGGLLGEIVLPYASLYGGGLGVFMMSSVIFVTGLALSFGTGIFTAAERIGEMIVALFVGSARATAKACKTGRESFAPKFKGALLTAGSGVMNPVRDAKRVVSEQINERVEQNRRVAEERKNKRFEAEEDSEEISGVEVEAEIVEEVKLPRSNFKATSKVAPPIERVVEAFMAEDDTEEKDEFAGGSFSVEAEAETVNSNEDEVVDGSVSFATDDVDFSDEVESNPYEALAAHNAAKKIQEEVDELKEASQKVAPYVQQPYQLPSLDLLDPVPERKGGNPAALAKRAKILESTLADFKIQGQVVHIERGPRITQFEISLAPGIKLSRVSGLQDNISMVLKAPSIRIIAPIPGKDTIGIEIPNINQELVTLREVVEAVDIDNRKQALPLCLAKDVSGKPIIADLAKMPHLLIAGATGSGKSVCINSIIMSFLSCLRYDECKLIMVDPKVVELSRFRDIPHLMSPVITDMQKAVGVLEWACQEMDQRYEKLSMVNVNNLAKFNALSPEEIEKRVARVYGEEELDNFPRKLPFIVIIIDELADLMMVAKKEVENHIARLAAKSRAVGIHLILATQRPSTDVITGLIKANMPSRIAFQVSSKIDSRIILDQMGADSLLGQGDMLYLPPGVSKVMRSQGVFVSDDELFRVVDHCKAQRGPEYHTALEGPVIGGADGDVDINDYDEYFLEAAERIIESGRGSVSLLQRKLGIGYGRASRIVDQLAEAGILGPFREGKAREILIDMDEYYAKYFGGGDNLGKGKYRQEEDAMVAGQRDDERAPF